MLSYSQLWERSSKVWKKNWRIENQRKNRDCPDDSTVMIDVNTQKSPGELKSLTITSVKRPPIKTGVKT